MPVALTLTVHDAGQTRLPINPLRASNAAAVWIANYDDTLRGHCVLPLAVSRAPSRRGAFRHQGPWKGLPGGPVERSAS